jgi:hypothetical protein
MTAATEGRNTKRRDGRSVTGLVNNGATTLAGTIATRLTANGNLVAGGTASAGPAVGVFEETVVGDGVKTNTYTRGTFQFANSTSTDAIGLGDVGSTCYIADNQTVAKTDNSGARKAAGTIVDVDAAGVWVRVG